MKTLALIGASKEMTTYLHSVLSEFEMEFKVITKCSITSGKFYNYVVVNSNCNVKDVSLSCDFCLVNMDSFLGKKIKLEVRGNIITLGRGNKNTVTLSSLDKYSNTFVYCLQREVQLMSGKKIYAEEIPIHINFKTEEELYALVITVTLALLEGTNALKVLETHNSLINC